MRKIRKLLFVLLLALTFHTTLALHASTVNNDIFVGLGAQMSEITEGKTSVRLIAGLGENLENVNLENGYGFKIEVLNSSDEVIATKNINCTALLTKVMAATNGVNVEVTAEERGATYLYALTITNTPAGTKLKVTPYVTTSEVVYDETRVVTVPTDGTNVSVEKVTENSGVVYEPGRNEEGYDYLTISQLEETSAPENGYYTFDATEAAKWTVLTANDEGNTQGFLNNIWLQLQATDTTGAYSVLVARCVTLKEYTSVAIKTGIIGAVGDSAYMRIRAMLSDNTIVTFTKTGLTDENGWFNSITAAAVNPYGWGPFDTVSVDVPEAVKGQTVKLIIEYDREPSSNWNVLLESLQFTNEVNEETGIEYYPGRNGEGYDYLTISELEETSAPENGYYTFDATEVAKWTVLTANDDVNTKALQNGTLLQLQAADITGAYSVLIARCVTLDNYTSVALKTAIIGNVGDSAYIRIRAMLSDNTIVTFTKEGLTDENGWFNSMTAAATNAYGWGPVDTVSLDVPEAVKGQTVKLIIEYDREPSSNWNVLLESLTFTE